MKRNSTFILSIFFLLIINNFLFSFNYINFPKKQLNTLKFYGSLERLLNEMTLEEKITQMFLVSIDGNSLSVIKKNLSNNYMPGGYLFFSYNIPTDIQELIEITSLIKQQKNAPFISIDHEGGDVNRLRKLLSKTPSPKMVTNLFNPVEAQNFYYYIGMQLKVLGFDMNIAPVVEAISKDNNEFLSSRSYGDSQLAKIYSEAQLIGMNKAGIYSVIKHFPGSNNEDPHIFLPVLELSNEELNNYFFQFSILNTVEKGILVSHSILPQFENIPSCLSKKAVNYIENNYQNITLVISDDILMKALLNNGYEPQKALCMAIEAGIDVIMISDINYTKYVDMIKREILVNPTLLNKIETKTKKIIRWKINHDLLEYINEDSGKSIIKNKVTSINEITLNQKSNMFNDYKEKADNCLTNLN